MTVFSLIKQCCECNEPSVDYVKLIDEAGQPAGRKYFCEQHMQELLGVAGVFLIANDNVLSDARSDA